MKTERKVIWYCYGCSRAKTDAVQQQCPDCKLDMKEIGDINTIIQDGV